MRSTLQLLFVLLSSGLQVAVAQDLYTVTTGEMIFSWAQAEFTEQFKNEYSNAEVINSPARFSAYVNVSQSVHYNFNNNFGVFSGGSVSNVGFISDELLPTIESPTSIDDYKRFKIIRRVYTLGVPVGLKIGAFDKNFYFFGGGRLEWAFNFKEKWWQSDKRKGDKTKRSDWFPSATETFLPSAFAGIQFAGGFNVKFNYYLTDLLDNKFTNGKERFAISNLTRYKSNRMMSISLSWQFLEDFERKNMFSGSPSARR